MARAVIPEIVATGDAAVTVVFGNKLDLTLNDRVMSLDSSLGADRIEGVSELVPGLASLLVRYDPLQISPTQLADTLRERLLAEGNSPTAPRTLWTVPVRYGSGFGPDLPAVADQMGLTEDGVIDAHTSLRLRVLMLGFAPGFAYLGLAGQEWDLPRRTELHQSVDPGSLFVAVRQTGFCGTAVPTGWWVIGHTPFRTFEPRSANPFPLRPGDEVQFEQIDDANHRSLSDLAEAGKAVALEETF